MTLSRDIDAAAGLELGRDDELDACPCWTDRELAARGLYCPACEREIAGDPPHSAAGGSWRV